MYEKLFRRNPLEKWVRTIPAISDFQLQEQEEGLSLKVKLDPRQVENLQATIEPFLREVLSRKKQPVTEVLIANEPPAELAEVYYKLSFALEEARMTGEYNTLYGVLQSLQAEEGEGDFRVYLGAEFLYVQLKKGNNSYFTVLPKAETPGGIGMTGGTKGGKG